MHRSTNLPAAGTPQEANWPRLFYVRTFAITALWLAVLAAYALWFDTLRDSHQFETLLGGLQDHPVSAATVYWLLMVAALMLPFSSSAVLLLVGLEVFGPLSTFLLALTAGGTATVLSYAAAYRVTAFAKGRPLAKIEAANRMLARWRGTPLLVFLARAIPNPLYDVWGYACGVARVPFATYFFASFAGGVVPLAAVCFLLPRFPNG